MSNSRLEEEIDGNSTRERERIATHRRENIPLDRRVVIGQVHADIDHNLTRFVIQIHLKSNEDRGVSLPGEGEFLLRDFRCVTRCRISECSSARRTGNTGCWSRSTICRWPEDSIWSSRSNTGEDTRFLVEEEKRRRKVAYHMRLGDGIHFVGAIGVVVENDIRNPDIRGRNLKHVDFAVLCGCPR